MKELSLTSSGMHALTSVVVAVAVGGDPERVGDDTMVGCFDATRGEVMVEVSVDGFGVATGADQVLLELGADVTVRGRVDDGW